MTVLPISAQPTLRRGPTHRARHRGLVPNRVGMAATFGREFARHVRSRSEGNFADKWQPRPQRADAALLRARSERRNIAPGRRISQSPPFRVECVGGKSRREERLDGTAGCSGRDQFREKQGLCEWTPMATQKAPYPIAIPANNEPMTTPRLEPASFISDSDPRNTASS